MISGGILLKVKKKLPCEKNGKSSSVAKGTYLYAVRYKIDGTAVECRTEKGDEILLFGTNDPGEMFEIEGRSQDAYFSNIQYAD